MLLVRVSYSVSIMTWSSFLVRPTIPWSLLSMTSLKRSSKFKSASVSFGKANFGFSFCSSQFFLLVMQPMFLYNILKVLCSFLQLAVHPISKSCFRIQLGPLNGRSPWCLPLCLLFCGNHIVCFNNKIKDGCNVINLVTNDTKRVTYFTGLRKKLCDSLIFN